MNSMCVGLYHDTQVQKAFSGMGWIDVPMQNQHHLGPAFSLMRDKQKEQSRENNAWTTLAVQLAN